ncbi:MAG: DUF349 domain-containing protein [Micrococcales bacterium]|nr:DUF349 domain-containing protein [Micrococcales bacterium]NBR55233.1 DUF349 domain-containing protein [Micrococcales bacterium]NBR62220.1 DUF349 domain-containing protein [Actinomycetota bacterium]
MATVTSSFGRIDENGNVFVMDNGTERLIGSQPSMSNEDAIALYVKRFDDLAATVRLLEQRVKAKADPKSIAKSATKTLAELTEAAAIGDLESLRHRTSAILSALSQALADAEAERVIAVEKALAEREAIAVAAEKIAAGDPTKTNYKNATVKMSELFEKWQGLQKTGVKVSKAKADAIWARFSKARHTFESNKRGYFSTQDQLAKASKNAKLELVTKAEALLAKGAEGSADYRQLLEAWKKLPKVKSKADDALWARFKSAGDAIYAARADKAAKDDIEYAANLEVKLALLDEAEKIDPAADLELAKKEMKTIQSKWEKAGKVPRDAIKATEERLRAVEQKIRAAEQELWRKSDPATIERTNSMKAQLEASIRKLEEELAKAQASGDSAKITKAKEALETKQAWLAVVNGN